MKFKLILIFLLFISCQPIEKVGPVIFDNKQLTQLSLVVNTIEIIELYEAKFSESYIDYSLSNPPILRIKSWMEENIDNNGNENKLVIKILDASIKQSEQENPGSNKFDEKFLFKYEMFYLVEYSLYDDADSILAITTVEGSRSTTSGKYISLNEKEIIIDDLILLTIKDFIDESEKLIKLYMKEYVL